MTPDIPDSFNLTRYVLSRAEGSPDKIAMAILGAGRAQRWSYARLEDAVRGAARGLLDQGLRAGDRVLIRLGNEPAFPISFLACLAVDLIPVPTSSQLTREEITAMAQGLSPRAIIASEGVAVPDLPLPVISIDEFETFYDLPPADYVMGQPDRPGYIIYTSGTSGKPRPVLHAHQAILARQWMRQGWYGLREDDRLLHAGAFNWTYTLGTGLMDPWAMGATALIPAPGTDVSALPLLLKRHDATIFAAAPGVYRQMLRHDVPAMPKLRHGLSAGEKLPETVRHGWMEKTGTPIHEAYGMSECSTFVSGSPARPAPEGSIGYVQDGRRIALIDETGSPADHGVIAVHKSDPGLMLGYAGYEDETAARFRGDWFLTGDVASRAADGALIYEGRNDDMMNAGGYRVSPMEVERALSSHPAIEEVAAAEVRVKADASVIAAFYTAEEELDPAALSGFAEAHLARYKCPRLYVRVKALPRGANNKLLRKKLRQEWEATHGQA